MPEGIMTSKEAQFPVLYTGMTSLWELHPEWPRSVPWAMMEAVESNCKRNHSQSVDRLARRGGLSYKEILWAVMGCNWSEVSCMTTEEAAKTVMQLVARYKQIAEESHEKPKAAEQPKRILPLTVMSHSTIRAQEIIATTLKKAGVCGSESLADLVVEALCDKTFTCPSCHGLDPNCDIC